jgi:putative salt-induced outer membrane protein YdiY
MISRASLSKFVFLYLFSFLAHAEQSTGVVSAEAKAKDAAESQAIIEQVKSVSTQEPGDTDKTWIPSAVKFDWIQLTSNEWLKGEIKGMYKDSLEFDSDKLDLLDIDWADVKILRTHKANNVNIEGNGATSGIMEVTGDSVEIINDYENKTYHRSDIISFAPGGKKERDLWAIKATLSIDLKQGNTDQIDYTAKVNIKRRGSTSRFLMDYIGNISKTNGGDGSLVETINNHRLNASYDYYKTRYFFYTPVFAEYFRDPFTNIDSRITLGTGLGYTMIDDGRTELSFSGGPAYVKTRFVSVAVDQNNSESTPAAVLRTNYDFELTKSMDFIARYNIQIGNKASGGYTHHIILTIENEISGALDFDTSFIWDRTSHPTQAEDGTTPEPNDYRVTFGISYTY